jgi:hypothetical protein
MPSYVVKAIHWARKYGIRINLDLHAMPGSQNGYNHAGRLNALNWMTGVMGIANAQRGLEVIRTIVEFISQPEYKDIVVMFGLVKFLTPAVPNRIIVPSLMLIRLLQVNEPATYELDLNVIGHLYVPSCILRRL